MSIEVSRLIWRSNLEGSTLLVALALADWADDEGRNVYPSFHRVAWKAKVSYKTVQRAVAMLMELGTIERVSAATQHKAAEYRIVLENVVKNAPIADYDSGWKPANDRDKKSTLEQGPRVDICGDKLSTYPLEDNPSEESPSPPKGKASDLFGQEQPKTPSKAEALEAEFEVFMSRYPQRDESDPRQPAKIKFLKARKDASFEIIMQALDGLVDAQTLKGNIGTQFVPKAKNWLKDAPWDAKRGAGARAKPELTAGEASQIKSWSAFSAALRRFGIDAHNAQDAVRRREFADRNGIARAARE